MGADLASEQSYVRSLIVPALTGRAHKLLFRSAYSRCGSDMRTGQRFAGGPQSPARQSLTPLGLLSVSVSSIF